MGLESVGTSVSHMQQIQSSTGQSAMTAVQQMKRAIDAGNNALDSEFQAKDKVDGQVAQIAKTVPGRIDTWA